MPADADVADDAALVLPGSQMNLDGLRINEGAIAFVTVFADAGKPVAAICHAPRLIIEAGLADGRDITAWPSIRTDLRNAGTTVHKRTLQAHHEPRPPGLQRSHRRRHGGRRGTGGLCTRAARPHPGGAPLGVRRGWTTAGPGAPPGT